MREVILEGEREGERGKGGREGGDSKEKRDTHV